MPVEPAALPPRARGVVVLAGTFLTLTILYGVWYAYSVFLVALLREYGWSRSVVAGAFSTFVLVHGGLSPTVGWLIRRVGPRRLVLVGSVVMAVGLVLMAETRQWWHLYLSFGVVAATGVSLAGWLPSVMLARGWFPGHVGTAVGITSSGIGVGILAVIPLAQLLIDQWGWRWAYRVLAACIVLYVVPASLTLIQDPPAGAPAAAAGSPSGGGGWTVAQAVATGPFWLLAGVYFTGNFATQMLLIHQVAYLVDHGVLPMTAAALGGAIGLISIAGKVGWGSLSDRTSRELAYGLAFACVAASLGALVLAGWRQTPPFLALYAALIGLGYGAMAPLPPAAANDLFGGPGFSTIFGALYTVGCVGLAGGAWTAGWIFDVSGSYAGALWLALGMAVCSPVLLWLAAPRRCRGGAGADGRRAAAPTVAWRPRAAGAGSRTGE